MAINPATIDPLALPSVSLQERSQLPTTPCIYFAIDSQGVVQYIGRVEPLYMIHTALNRVQFPLYNWLEINKTQSKYGFAHVNAIKQFT